MNHELGDRSKISWLLGSRFFGIRTTEDNSNVYDKHIYTAKLFNIRLHAPVIYTNSEVNWSDAIHKELINFLHVCILPFLFHNPGYTGFIVLVTSQEDWTREDAGWAELIGRCAFCLCTGLTDLIKGLSRSLGRVCWCWTGHCILGPICSNLNAWQYFSLLVRSHTQTDTSYAPVTCALHHKLIIHSRLIEPAHVYHTQGKIFV